MCSGASAPLLLWFGCLGQVFHRCDGTTIGKPIGDLTIGLRDKVAVVKRDKVAVVSGDKVAVDKWFDPGVLHNFGIVS